MTPTVILRHFQRVANSQGDANSQCGKPVGWGFDKLWVTHIPCKVTCRKCRAGLVSCH